MAHLLPQTLYVTGPMDPVGYHHNSFLKAEEQLRDAGYRVLSPLATPARDSFAGWQRDRLEKLIKAEGVAALPGWDLSVVGRFEVSVAHALSLPVLPVERWLELA